MVTSLAPFHPPPALAPRATHRGRIALASFIRSGALALDWLAERVAPQEATSPEVSSLARVEYHCEGGAPEGALYVDGVLWGHLRGVDRL
jgi:hypothetical protein